MNVELFIYLKLYLLCMFKVSHLDEEATRHEKETQLTHPFISLSFSVSRFYRFFLTFAVNIVSIHYIILSPSPDAGEAY